MKFNKPPKLVKKTDNLAGYEQLKKAAMKQKQINMSINKMEEPAKMPPTKRKLSSNTANFKKKDSITDKSSERGEKSEKKTEDSSDPFEIQGNSVVRNELLIECSKEKIIR